MGPGEYHKDRDPEGPAFTIPEARRGSPPAKETTVGPGEYHGCGLDTAGAAWTMGQKPKARVRCRRDPVPQERRPAAVPMHAVAEGGASAAAHGRTGISGCSGGGPRARACAACPRVRRVCAGIYHSPGRGDMRGRRGGVWLQCCRSGSLGRPACPVVHGGWCQEAAGLLAG